MVLLTADTQSAGDPTTPLEALVLQERSVLFPAEEVRDGCLFPRQCDNCGGYEQYTAGDLLEPLAHLRVEVLAHTSKTKHIKAGQWRGPLVYKSTCLEGCWVCRGCRAGSPPPLCDWCRHKFPGSSACSEEAHEVMSGPSVEEENVDVSLRAACPMHISVGRSVRSTQPAEVPHPVLQVRSPCGRHAWPVVHPTSIPAAVMAVTRCSPTCCPHWSRLVTEDTGTVQPTEDMEQLLRDDRADLEDAALHLHARVAQRLLDGSLMLDSLSQEQQGQLKNYAAFVVAELKRYNMLLGDGAQQAQQQGQQQQQAQQQGQQQQQEQQQGQQQQQEQEQEEEYQRQDEQEQQEGEQQEEQEQVDAAWELLQLAAAPAATTPPAAAVAGGQARRKRKKDTPRRCTTTVSLEARDGSPQGAVGRSTRRKTAAAEADTAAGSHSSEGMQHSASSAQVQEGQEPHAMQQEYGGSKPSVPQPVPSHPSSAVPAQSLAPSEGVLPSLPALPDTTDVMEAAGPILELMVALQMSDHEQLQACNRLESMQGASEGARFMNMAYRAMRLQAQHNQRSALALFVRAKLLG